MKIGIPREIREGESCVSLTPVGVRHLVNMDHRVYVEQGAGERVGYSDHSYADAGAELVYSAEEVYWRSDLITKVERPTAEEFDLLKEDSTLISFLQLAAARPDTVATLLHKRINAIAMETIESDDGELPVIHAMSQIGGRMTPGLAARFLDIGNGGSGVLIAGVPGVPPANVVIIGAGMFGQETALAFVQAGAHVTVLDRQVKPLGELEQRVPLGRIRTRLAHPETIAQVISDADVVVTAASVPGKRAPMLITRDMVRSMRPGSLIMDVSITQGGCVETSRPTSLREPVFTYANVTHYCVPNIPAAMARTTTQALANSTWPFIEMIAERGLEATIEENRAIARGVWTYQGELTQRAASPYVDMLEKAR